MCLCIAFAHAFTVLSGMQLLEGTPNGVKFDITKPDKITKIAKSHSLRQEFQCISINSFVYI